MNRGSATRAGVRARRRHAFNEAPIHESGKCWAKQGTSLACPRPSMRPRFMNRGSQVGQATKGSSNGYFNEAPIHESGKFHTPAHL